MVMAERGNGTKLESTIPRPEILLTEVWLGTRKKLDCRCNNGNSCCQDQNFQQNLSILQLFFHVNSPYLIFYGWEDPFLILMAF